jgi:hypothetical protein
MAFVFGLAVINATGVYAQLASAHVGERGAAQSHIEMKDAAFAAKIEMATHNAADLDRRLGQIDTTIEEAAKRGRTKTAIDAIEAQRRARAALVDERKREAATLWWARRRNAPQWLPRAVRSRRKLHQSGMSPSSSASIRTARRQSGG